MDFVVVYFKGKPPVARNRNAPRSGSITGKLMDAPPGRTLQPRDILDALQGGEDAPDSVHQIAPDAPVVVIFNEVFQPLDVGQSESSCPHDVRLSRTPVKHADPARTSEAVNT
jgi:hypothetical protein